MVTEDFLVVLSPQAQDDLIEAYRNAAKHAPEAAERWLARFESTVETLSQNPSRCPPATEDHKSTHNLSELLYGKRPNVFRVVFMISERKVQVLKIRRAARQVLSKQEIQQSIDAAQADQDFDKP